MAIFRNSVAQLSPNLLNALPDFEATHDSRWSSKVGYLESKIKETYPAMKILGDEQSNSVKVFGLWEELIRVQKTLHAWSLSLRLQLNSIDAKPLDFSQPLYRDQCIQTDDTVNANDNGLCKMDQLESAALRGVQPKTQNCDGLTLTPSGNQDTELSQPRRTQRKRRNLRGKKKGVGFGNAASTPKSLGTNASTDPLNDTDALEIADLLSAIAQGDVTAAEVLPESGIKEEKFMRNSSDCDDDNADVDVLLFSDLDPFKQDKSNSPKFQEHYSILDEEHAELSDRAEGLRGGTPHKKRTYQCKFCKHSSKDAKGIRDHLLRNHLEKAYSCEVCGKTFGVKRDLNRHFLVHTSRRCSEQDCAFTCTGKRELNKHLAEIHGHSKHSIEPISCDFDACEYSSKSAKNLAMHVKRVHGERKFKCSICDKMFSVKKDLNQHARLHVQMFTCEECGKTLKTPFALDLHVKNIHRKLNIRTSKSCLCAICGKLCHSKTFYKVHMNKVHLNIKPFKCTQCDMSFHARANLQRHLSVHSDDRKFTCPVCNKAFKQRRGLVIHSIIHKEIRPYKCSKCSKSFTQKGALTRHERIHTGEKPYACKLCNSSFSDFSILRRHVLKVHEVDDLVLVRKTASPDSINKCLADKTYLRKGERKIRVSREKFTAEHKYTRSDAAVCPEILSTDASSTLGTPIIIKPEHSQTGAIKVEMPTAQITSTPIDKVNIILAAAQQSFLGETEREQEVQAAQALSHLQGLPVSVSSSALSAFPQLMPTGSLITLSDGRQGRIIQQIPQSLVATDPAAVDESDVHFPEVQPSSNSAIIHPLITSIYPNASQ